MNIPDYLSELLVQYNEVNVPGLGCFVRIRKNAWYNEKESRFYPPYHQLKFIAQTKDDDIFTQYLAAKKNITIESSKFFTEKFVSNLKEQAETGNFPFADLGWFSRENKQLVFKPNDRIITDPYFYGYGTIDIKKTAPTLNLPESGEEVHSPLITLMPLKASEKDNYYEEETDKKRPVNIWMVLMALILIAALGLFGTYKYYPEYFNKLVALYHKKFDNKTEYVPVSKAYINPGTETKKVAKVDTLVKSDSATKTSVTQNNAVIPKVALPVSNVTPVKSVTANKQKPLTKPSATVIKTDEKQDDTVKTTVFEIVAGSFRTKTKAQEQVKIYNKKGFDAKIAYDVTGTRFHISVGTYITQEEALSKCNELKNSGKIPEDSYVQPIINKQ